MSDSPINLAPQNVQEEWLARMTFSSRVLWQLWRQAPSAERLRDLAPFLDEWPLGEEHKDIQSGLAFMKAGRAEDLAALATDYADLFIGPDTLKAAPWGSVYLNEEQITFGETMLAVRAFYKDHGLEIATGEHEPDDHIGLMFAFIAWLGETGLEQSEMNPTTQNYKPLTDYFNAISQLLSEHMLTWAPRLCQLVEERATTDFYKGLGLVTVGTLTTMAELVGATARPARLYR